MPNPSPPDVAASPMSAPAADAARAALRRASQSATFRGARRQVEILTYVVEEALAGRSDRLKGYSIAIDVLRRQDAGTPEALACVRVHMSRLRDRLANYYDTDGRYDPVQITLTAGSYVPSFAPGRASPLLAQPTQADPQSTASSRAPDPRRSRLRMTRFYVALALFGCASIPTWLVTQHHTPTVVISEMMRSAP